MDENSSGNSSDESDYLEPPSTSVAPRFVLKVSLADYKKDTRYAGKNFSAKDLSNIEGLKLCSMIKKIHFKASEKEVGFFVHHVNPPSCADLPRAGMVCISALEASIKRGSIFRNCRISRFSEDKALELAQNLVEGEPSPKRPCITITSPSSTTTTTTFTDLFFLAGQIKGKLDRVLHALQDPEAHLLFNDVGKQLIYELFSFLFSLQDNISVRFSTTGRVTQCGGWTASLLLLGNKAVKFTGVPDVVVKGGEADSLLIVEIKNGSESRLDGHGQLLITLLFHVMIRNRPVLGLLIHPESPLESQVCSIACINETLCPPV